MTVAFTDYQKKLILLLFQEKDIEFHTIITISDTFVQVVIRKWETKNIDLGI